MSNDLIADKARQTEHPSGIRPESGAFELAVAPMMDWTDRHCRYFHRLLSPNAVLYTEMVTTGAILHGDKARFLDFEPAEHPVVLQLGGADAKELEVRTRWGARWGYDAL